MAKQISQNMFDEVVRENISEFDMEPQEALDDAVQQFVSQGVDLSLIIKDLNLYSGGDDDSSGEGAIIHPVVAALNSLSPLLSENSSDEDSLTTHLNTIKLECQRDLAHRYLASKHQAFSTLMTACQKFTDKSDIHLLSLQTLCTLISGQPDLLTFAAILHFTELLKVETSNEQIVLETLKIIQNSCTMHESNRQTFVAEGLINQLVLVLDRYRDNGKIIAQACVCLRTLTLDDDVRVPFGKAHEHAKMIVTEANALKTILDVCKAYIDDEAVLAELFSTLSKLAVRNEFCQEIIDLGGLPLMLNTLEKNMNKPSLTKQVIGVLKAIAGNDDVKVAIVTAGGIELIMNAMSKHQRHAAICEVSCSAIAIIILRQPAHCARVMEAGGVDVILKTMQLHQDSPAVQKNCCMAIRNLIARSREYVPQFLEFGAENLINLARNKHQSCHDEAKAALRDLGCKVDLKELWTGEGRGITQ